MSVELHQRIAGRLRDDGQRYTSNRRDLVDVLLTAARPITIPEIMTSRDGLAQSSVYRNLTVMERAGVVTRVVTNGEWGRYELAEDLTGHHHHAICSECGAVADVELGDRLERAILAALDDVSERTGFATGMTNGTKTVGGAIASAVFAIALSSTGSLAETEVGHAPLSGYITVWAVCAAAALVAAAALLVVPKGAFADSAELHH
mgnify:CR=1 FL=1